MPPLDIHITLHLSGILIYLVLMVVTIRQRGIRDTVARWLSFYLGVSIILELVSLFEVTRPHQSLPDIFFENLNLYENLIRGIFLMHLGVLFFRRKTDWLGWAVGLSILVTMIFLDALWFMAPYIISLGRSTIIDGLTILKAGLIIGWVLIYVRIVWRTVQTYRYNEFIVTRPRMVYWSMGLALVILGDGLNLLLREIAGTALQVIGAVLISYIVLTTRLPDIKGIFQRLSFVFVSAIFELSIYTIGILLFYIFFGEFIVFQRLIISLGLGLILLFLLNPFLSVLKRWLRRLFFGREWDDRLLMREFSKNLSSVLDLNLLSAAIVSQIGNRIAIREGTIFTVDSEVSDSNERQYRLVNVQKISSGSAPPGLISAEGPIATHFVIDRKPVTLAEIEMLPAYQRSEARELNWFMSQKFAIFVPVFGMEEWIGLLALGPKSSGSSFTKSDIHLMETLADQIAVGLQNAKLVESLVRVNNEFRRAYSAMEEAHAKLERLDRTKSDFISITSHELRTPLTVVSGYSQMLMEDPIYEDNDYYKKVIEGIYHGATRLHEIVDTMLDVAKIDTRALELKQEPTNVKELIQQVYLQFREPINERNLVLTFDSLDDLPTISGDPESLEKVFYHIVSNAIKYTPDGGVISISGSEIPKDDPRFPAGGVQVVISDTGIGIDPRFKELIFSKFYQTGELVSHSSGKTRYKGGGPGLGLAIVHGIIQAHGGQVWAESPGYDEDKLPGSKFFVILPLEPIT